MHKVIEIILWFIVLAILLSPVAYIIWCAPSNTFWENIASGIIATAAALIGGIPLAFWIDRTIKHREEERKKQLEQKNELELLELIKEEITFTESLLEHRKGNIEVIQIQPLKTDLWFAITSTSKLNLITNHRLLNRITSAYYVINLVKDLEDQTYKATRGAAVRFEGGQTAAQLLLKDARSFDQLLTDSIREALKEIDDEIAKIA